MFIPRRLPAPLQSETIMAEPIIQVNKLSYQYPNSQTWALSNISFQVQPGEFVGIVGPTGAGKTTLAMCLRGLIPHNFGGSISGSVHVAGKNVFTTNPGNLADTVGIVFQNAETQAIGLTVLEDLAFGLGNLNIPTTEMWKRIERVAEIVKIRDLLERETWALSGGQKQRLAIGGVLVMQPKILILDEPTAELDPAGKTEIFETIEHIRAERELTILMIEHEVEALAESADRILVLCESQLHADGNPETVFQNIDLFKNVHEKVPFAAEVLADLLRENIIPDGQFTPREAEVVEILQHALREKR